EAEGLAGRRVAVEVNGTIVPRGQHEAHALADGDQVEIVHALGGGGGCGLRKERRAYRVLAGRFGRAIHGPTHRAWAIHGPLRQHPARTPPRRFGCLGVSEYTLSPRLTRCGAAPLAGGTQRRCRRWPGHPKQLASGRTCPGSQLERLRRARRHPDRFPVRRKPAPPCATPTKPPGRRPCDVLLEQARDGRRPVSRAMDGATEPASKHVTRATLPPEPTPRPWCDNRGMSENTPHIANDPLVIAGVSYESRLLTGTGKFKDLDE